MAGAVSRKVGRCWEVLSLAAPPEEGDVYLDPQVVKPLLSWAMVESMLSENPGGS